MAYFHHQFQQIPAAQAAFNNGQFFQDHDTRFQQPQTMGQFPLHGRGWVDPYTGGTLLHSHRTETKPRLSKGEVAKLEAVFQDNNKPSSSIKKGLAEQMRVDVARINNWFQNRRAKKKQELKAKEHEANAEAEKEKEEREANEASDTNDNVSSADQTEPAVKREPRSPIAFDNEARTVQHDQIQESPNPDESCPGDDQINYFSREGSTAAYKCEQPLEFTSTDDATYFAAHSGNNLVGNFDSGLGVPGYSMEGRADGPEAFSYGALMFSGISDGMSPFETRVDGLEKNTFTSYQTETVQESIEPNYQKASPQVMENPSPLITQSFRLSSPPAVDLAGRRKRPGLALSGIRNNANGPATGIDFSRRGLDPGCPMRRVTSATGFGPQGIRRFPSQQRLGMFERRQESLLSAVRSPNMTPFASMAPPTPDTPAVATHQQSVREATVSSNSSEDEGSVHLYQSTALSTQQSALDQSVRTPPATPIGVGDVFATSIGATLGYPPTTDESFLASGMDAFSMRSNDFSSIPSYITDGYMSQPSTPQLPMSTGYYNAIPASNAEYSWADAAMVSTKSSPNPHQMRQIQFSNVTPQDFSGAK